MHFPAFLRPALLALATASVSMIAPAQTPSPAPAASTPAAQRFDILEFQVEGNTVLTVERIERAVYPFMGEGRTIDDADGARAALEKTYHDSGYATVAVDIPPQKVVGGVVVLKVVEGRIAHLHVVGAHYFSQDRILAGVPALAEGGVPHLPEVQQQLVAVNTSADKRVTPLLRPGKDPGTTDVDLQVDDQLPLHGSVELNNDNAPHTRAARLLAGLSYGNLFQRDQTLGLQLQVSPTDISQVKVLAATYVAPIADATLLFSAVRSDSNSFVGGGVGVLGTGDVFGFRYLRSLASDPPLEGLTQSLALGVDYKDFQQNVSLADGTGIPSPIRYVPFSVNYSGTRADKAGSTEFNAGLTFALRGLGSSDQQFADKRYLGTSSFSVLKFGFGRTQTLSGGMSLYAHFDGQIARQPLISNEQYIAGGASSVRGYLESVAAGDEALRSTLEWRSRLIEVPRLGSASLQGRLFVEGAFLRQLSQLPGTPNDAELLSTGAGLTLLAKPGLTVRADLAWPLRAVTFQAANSPRLQASAVYAY